MTKGTHQLLVTLAQLPQVRDGDTTRCSPFLADLLKYHQPYANFGAARKNGDVYCSAIPLAGPVNISGREHFQRAVESRDFAIGDYRVGQITRKPTVSFGYPVIDNFGQVQAVVFASLDLNWFDPLVLQMRPPLPQDAAFMKIDKEGIVLARYPEPENWVGKPLPEKSILKTALTQSEGIVEALGSDGIARLYAFAATHS